MILVMRLKSIESCFGIKNKLSECDWLVNSPYDSLWYRGIYVRCLSNCGLNAQNRNHSSFCTKMSLYNPPFQLISYFTLPFTKLKQIKMRTLRNLQCPHSQQSVVTAVFTAATVAADAAACHAPCWTQHCPSPLPLYLLPQPRIVNLDKHHPTVWPKKVQGSDVGLPTLPGWECQRPPSWYNGCLGRMRYWETRGGRTWVK